MKVVINSCFGGFSLSQKAADLYMQRTGIKIPDYDDLYDKRDDPVLIAIVEELGPEADGPFAELAIVEIPDEYEYCINDYDGFESIGLCIREDHLRKLIKAGDEEAIVNYVMFDASELVKYVGEDDEEDE